MKLKTLLIAFMMPALLWAQETTPQSPLQFDSYEWNFGNIDEADGIVTHTFQFMNISKEPVQIENIATSCGCVTAQYPTQPIEGGKYGEITVHLNPARTQGEVFREIEIFTKGRRSYDRLFVFADVNPIPMGLNELYPHQLAGTVKTNSLRCNFGYVAQGETMTRVVSLANVGDKPVNLSIHTTKGYGMSVQYPEVIDSQEIVSIRVTYKIPTGKQHFGMTRDTLWIEADGVRSTEPIAVNALRIEKFSENENRPKPVMRIEPAYVEFGSKSPGKNYKKTITIGNTGNSDLVFHDVEVCQGTSITLKNGQKIKPGKELKVTVSITNSSSANETTIGSINLTTNDPTRPFRELRLQIDTK